MKAKYFEEIPQMKMRCIGEHECRFENGKLVLPETFEVPDGPISFVQRRDGDLDYLHFSYDEALAFEEDVKNATVQGGFLIFPSERMLYRILPQTPIVIGILDHFEVHLSRPAFDLTDEGKVSESEQQKRLAAYLEQAEIAPMEIGKYNFLLGAMSGLKEPGNIFPGVMPTLRGLPLNLCKSLFVLQHLAYEETVLCDDCEQYKAKRHYYSEYNRRMLARLREQPQDPCHELLIAWAERQPPIRVPVKVLIATLYRKTGMFGIREPYEEDLSTYRSITVFV